MSDSDTCIKSASLPPSLKYNFLYHNDVPKVTLNESCVLGIDEAGRGPVLGPMVYGGCYFPKSFIDEFTELKFDDSKKLTKEKRENLFELLDQHKEKVGWIIHSLSPQFISTCMLRKSKYNLNSLAHDTTVGIIQKLIDLGVMIDHVYVDTVGPPDKYQEWLGKQFPSINFTVAKKADSLYPCVSGASIVAKVIRDSILDNWEQTLDPSLTKNFGSGYTSDPYTKEWLSKNLDPVFGYSPVVRFSWSTIEDLLDKKGVNVIWPKEESKSQSNIDFPPTKYRKTSDYHNRAPFFKKRKMTNL